MAHEVFISHSSRDKPVVDIMCAMIEAQGIRCWRAPRDIVPGMEWGEAIMTGIRESRVMVLVFSTHANQSQQVRREIERAIHHDLLLIPFRIEDIMPSGAMEYFLSTPHWQDALTAPLEPHIDDLIATLQRVLPRQEKPDEPQSVPEAVAAAPAKIETAPALDARQTPAPALAPGAPRHNLPHSLTPLIGREEELRACCELLRHPESRLVTLIGFGGMGKTRLALQAGHQHRDEFSDGVWWVGLDSASNGEEMIGRIAEQLKLHLNPQPTVREQLWNFHRERHLLLILDNLEQIQGNEAAQVIQDLLHAGQRVKCLVTSRRSLNLAVERLIEMPPLPAQDALELFVERARARKASFALTAQNTPDVRRICDVLEGVPLAIEIAASLVVLLSPPQILKRLDDQLKLLVGRDPTQPRRHHALRAAIDWSFNLLSEGAKTLFADLSVFAGGFTFDAAEAVCQTSDVLDELMELRAHSLLRSKTDPETGEERLLMLAALREYATEKLDDEKLDDGEVARRHARYFFEWASEKIASLRTREEAGALHALEDEFDNLRAALNWAEANDPQLCAGLAMVFSQPLYVRGFWTEAAACLQKGWVAAQESGEDGQTVRAALQHHLGSLADDNGDAAAAREHAAGSLEAYRALDDAAGIANALNLLGLLDTQDGDLDAAQQHFEAAMRQWPRKDYSGRAKTLHNLARRDDAAQARQKYQESLVQRRLAGDARGEATTLGNLGALAQEAGDHAEAHKLYKDSLELRRTLREPFGIAVMLFNLGEVAALDADVERAIVLFTHAERIFGDLHSPYAEEAAAALNRLQTQLGAEYFNALRQDAEQAAWEDVV